MSRFGGWGPARTAGSHGRSWMAPASLDPIIALSHWLIPPPPPPPASPPLGDEERIRMAQDNLRKAKAKVVEKEKGIEALDRSVQRMEVVLAAAVDKVKEEEVEEVVEVDVEPEEMVEETVKESPAPQPAWSPIGRPCSPAYPSPTSELRGKPRALAAPWGFPPPPCPPGPPWPTSWRPTGEGVAMVDVGE